MKNNIKIILFVSLLLSTLAVVLFAQDDASYIIEKNISNMAKKSGELNIIRFTVSDNTGELYEIHTEVDYDIPFPSLKLFNDGSAVLINAFDATLSFYNASGSEITKLNILKDRDISNERSVYSSVSDQSIIIAVNQPGMEYVLVQRYNKAGKFDGQFIVNEKYIKGLNYSQKADIIALSVFEWQQDIVKKTTLFLNSNGEQIARIHADFSHGYFLEDQNLFIGYSNKTCFIYDLNDKKVLFSKNAMDYLMILSAKIAEKQIIIIEARKPTLNSGKWYYKNPIFSYYDLDGHLLKRKTTESRPFAEYHLLSKDKHLLFQMPDQSIQIDE